MLIGLIGITEGAIEAGIADLSVLQSWGAVGVEIEGGIAGRRPVQFRGMIPKLQFSSEEEGAEQ